MLTASAKINPNLQVTQQSLHHLLLHVTLLSNPSHIQHPIPGLGSLFRSCLIVWILVEDCLQEG